MRGTIQINHQQSAFYRGRLVKIYNIKVSSWINITVLQDLVGAIEGRTYVPSLCSASRVVVDEPTLVDHLNFVVAAVSYEHPPRWRCGHPVRFAEACNRTPADHITCSSITCHRLNIHPLVDNSDSVILAVRYPDVPSLVNRNIVGVPETCHRTFTVNQSSNASCRPSH